MVSIIEIKLTFLTRNQFMEHAFLQCKLQEKRLKLYIVAYCISIYEQSDNEIKHIKCIHQYFYLTNKISLLFVSFKILRELKTDILNYTPVNENVSAANILLIGQIGAGKSSVLNSVNSIYRGKITSRALCGSFEHSLTTTVSPNCRLPIISCCNVMF